MCKYCKLITYNGEQSNDVQSILKLKDGSQIFEIYLNRYKAKSVNNNELLLDYDITIDGCVHTLKEKRIKIKYCPFCGEEL